MEIGNIKSFPLREVMGRGGNLLRFVLLSALSSYLVFIVFYSSDSRKVEEVYSHSQVAAVIGESKIDAALQKYCSDCHSGEDADGDFSLDGISSANFSKDLSLWNEIGEKLKFGEMPPADEDHQPSVEVRAELTQWIKATLAAAGREPDWEHKLLYPDYGNYLDHASLFERKPTSVAYSPSRLWKKSPHIFDSQLLKGMGLGKGRYGRPHHNLSKVRQPFTQEDVPGVKDYAAIFMADSATFDTLLRNAEAVVEKYLAKASEQLHVRKFGPIPDSARETDAKGKPIIPRHPNTPEAFSSIIFGEKSPTDEQVDKAIELIFNLLIERDPRPEEFAKYRQFMRQSEKLAGKEEALRVMLIAVAVNPYAIYRSELGQGPVDQHGRQMMGPADLAFAISYALTDDKPDDVLMKAAKTGNLKTREDVVLEVARIWDDEKIEKARILRFFHEFFGYHRAPTVFKDEFRYGHRRHYAHYKVADELVKDADTLVMHIVREDKDVFKQLLTTERYFIDHPGDNSKAQDVNKALAAFYRYCKEHGAKEWGYHTPHEHLKELIKINREMFKHANGNVIKGWLKYMDHSYSNDLTPMPRKHRHEFLTAYGLHEDTFSYPVEQPFVLARLCLQNTIGL